MELPENRFKARLKTGDLQIGLWSTLVSPIVAEIISHSGFDWILLDTEHTPNEMPTLVAQMQAMATSAITPMIRPAWNDPVLIKRILDMGAPSLLIPFVQNPAEAQAAVAATRYPPQGIRGVSASSRASQYGRINGYLQQSAEQIAVIVQIETNTALQNLEAIASVTGVDGVFIGPADLAASLGYLGNPGHPAVQAAIHQAIETLKSLQKPAGILAFNPDDAQRYIEWGYRFVAVGSDQSVLKNGTETLAARFHNLAQK